MIFIFAFSPIVASSVNAFLTNLSFDKELLIRERRIGDYDVLFLFIESNKNCRECTFIITFTHVRYNVTTVSVRGGPQTCGVVGTMGPYLMVFGESCSYEVRNGSFFHEIVAQSGFQSTSLMQCVQYLQLNQAFKT